MVARALVLLSATAAALVVSGCTLGRPTDPVVIKGSDVPALQSVAAGDVVAFSWADGWHQVAVQVDERKQVDLGTVYNAAATGFSTTVYADPNTFTGADGNANVDADDEIAFRAVDAGLEAPGDATPPAGTVARLRREAQPEHVHRRQDEEGLDLPLQAQRQPEPRRRQAVRELRLQPALGRLQDHLQAPGRPEPRELDGHDALLHGPLLGSLAQRPAEDHHARLLAAWTSSTAPSPSSRPATAAARRTPSTTPRAPSSPTRAVRSAPSAPTSGRTAVR